MQGQIERPPAAVVEGLREVVGGAAFRRCIQQIAAGLGDARLEELEQRPSIVLAEQLNRLTLVAQRRLLAQAGAEQFVRAEHADVLERTGDHFSPTPPTSLATR